METLTTAQAEARHIKRDQYVSCSVAFIDCKKPGSHLKENYSIIGPGVTSSDEQIVNLPEPHGFNIGAAAMPNGITNNLHIHFTAEVFIVHRGEWTFRWGKNGENEYVGRAGDIVSIPTWVFRGFTNSGPDNGWLFTVLGGDNTGGVIFHPDIIREAADYGLYISLSNRLIDTSKGDPQPTASQCITPMSDADVESLRVVTVDEMLSRIVNQSNRHFLPAFIDQNLPGCGVEIAPVIGYGMTQNRNHVSRITNPHGFSVEWLRFSPGQMTGHFSLDEKMVFIVHKGALNIHLAGGAKITLNTEDTYSVPAAVQVRLIGDEALGSEVVVVISGDGRKRPIFSQEVLTNAKKSGLDLDANGYFAKATLLPVYGREI